MSAEPRRIRKITRVPDAPQHTLISKARKIPGYVTLPQLAEERRIQPQLARLWIKQAGAKRPYGNRWMWKEGSKELKRIRQTLGLS